MSDLELPRTWHLRWSIAFGTTFAGAFGLAIFGVLAVTPRWVGPSVAAVMWVVVARRPRRMNGLLPVGELVLADSWTEGQTARGGQGTVPAKVSRIGADRRIQVSIYDRRWRAGPIGAALTRVARAGAQSD